MLEPGATLGDYVVRLAAPDAASCFVAEHTKLGTRVRIHVVGVMGPDRAELERRTRILNALGHPNIETVYSVGSMPDGGVYFITPELEGRTLPHHLRDGSLDTHRLLIVVSAVASALDEALARGLVHTGLDEAAIFLCSPFHGSSSVKLRGLLEGDAASPGQHASGALRFRFGAMVYRVLSHQPDLELRPGEPLPSLAARLGVPRAVDRLLAETVNPSDPRPPRFARLCRKLRRLMRTPAQRRRPVLLVALALVAGGAGVGLAFADRFAGSGSLADGAPTGASASLTEEALPSTVEALGTIVFDAFKRDDAATLERVSAVALGRAGQLEALNPTEEGKRTSAELATASADPASDLDRLRSHGNAVALPWTELQLLRVARISVADPSWRTDAELHFKAPNRAYRVRLSSLVETRNGWLLGSVGSLVRSDGFEHRGVAGLYQVLLPRGLDVDEPRTQREQLAHSAGGLDVTTTSYRARADGNDGTADVSAFELSARRMRRADSERLGEEAHSIVLEHLARARDGEIEEVSWTRLRQERVLEFKLSGPNSHARGRILRRGRDLLTWWLTSRSQTALVYDRRCERFLTGLSWSE